ncbi:hypothetical protein M407DRAFT_33942 [Tulasnella calospora MUT 4182]|uniref:Uncharacterized protein n=1 Tax=Tulasnella calospora MUT 4182 TaxID=1051891 RepID=A0A0C3PPJ0_9AGAM|nr:hypothetical protein M407DRAFT_33942 [Tulasnella calospora MUT 4182]
MDLIVINERRIVIAHVVDIVPSFKLNSTKFDHLNSPSSLLPLTPAINATSADARGLQITHNR